jgi:NADH-quinone oxidoreductase subunit A
MASNPYFSLAVLFVAALGFGLAPLGLAWLWAKVFSPAKPNAVKNDIYECGLESRGDAWMQFHSAYYLYAIIFLIFDVEAVFLLPFQWPLAGWARRLAEPCWCLCCCWWRVWRGLGPRAC